MGNFKKNQGKIIFMVILALVLQIAAPLVGDLSFADGKAEQESIETEEAPASEADEYVIDGDEEEEIEDLDESEKTKEAEDPDNKKDDSNQTPEKVEITGVKSILADLPQVLSGESKEPRDLGNIFTDVILQINGENVTENENITIEITDGTTVGLEFDWELADEVDFNSGDYSKIKIPDQFKGILGQMEGNLFDENNIEVGTFEIGEDNYLTVTFNEKLEDKDSRKGKVGFLLKFDLKEFEDDASQIIEFGEPVSKIFDITLKPKGETSLISKSGSSDQAINAKNINWVIDVNTSLDSLENASIEDIIPEGLELDLGSIEMFELAVGYNAKLTEGDKIEGLSISETDEGFKVEIGETNKAYRIKYKTKIVDYPEDGYENKVILKDNDDVKDSAKYKIDKIERGSLIEKSGWKDKDINAEKITWRIDINKAEQDLKNVSIEDVIPEGLELVDGTIQINKLKKDGDKWRLGDKVIKDPKITEFPVVLGDIDGEAYRIEFQTNIIHSDEYKKSTEFINEAILKVDEEEYDRDNDKLVVNRDTLLDKRGIETTNYDIPEITWTIDLNKANHNIKNATITDVIGNGLKLREGSIKVNGVEVPTGGDEYPRLFESKDKGFTLEFGDIDSSYTIKYITDITNPDLVAFDNEVGLKGDGLKGDGIGEDATITKKPSVKPTVKNTYKKGRAQNNKTIDGIVYDGLNYKEKTMSWLTTVDAKKETITELTITDTFNPGGSMVFVADSLRMTKGGELVDNTNDSIYTLEPKGKDGFVLIFKNPLDRAKYEIYYKTSFDPDEVLDAGGTLNTGKTYENIAKFEGKTKDVNGKEGTIGTNGKANYPIKVEIFNGGKKDGNLDREGRTITWKLYVNALGQDLTGEDFIVKDTLSEGQVFDENSIVIKEYALNKDGTIEVDDDSTLDQEKYNLVLGSDKDEFDFTLTFKDGIEKPFLIEYKSKIKGISEKEYSNTANTTGKGTEKRYDETVEYEYYDKFVVKGAENIDGEVAYTDDEINWKVNINESLSEIYSAVFKDNMSEGHVYINDSLKLYKGTISEENLVELDDEDLQVTISEAGETQIKISLGDIDTNYIVTYNTVIVATGGEVTNNASLSGDKFEPVEGNESSYNVLQSSWGIGTGKDRGRIKIVKRDADTGAKIANNPAKFELFYYLNNDETKEYIVTGEAQLTEHGEIKYGNLPYRTYYLREIEAPEGYELLDEILEIVVNKEEESIEKEVMNTKKKTEVRGTKLWEGGPTPRPTIELQLFRDGEALGEPVKLVDGRTSYTWKDLDLTDIDGKPHVYTVDEVKRPENYGKSISEDKLTIINTYESPVTDVVGRKIWIGGPEEKPSIQLQLYRDGSAYDKPVTLASGETEYIWKDLDLTNNAGKEYIYTVKEVGVPENYDKVEEGLKVTNTYVSPKTRVTGTKEWIGGPTPKPTIELQLFRDGEALGEPVELKDGTETYTWTNLDETDENGKKYVYTVDEVERPENYGKSISENKLTITNTYESPVTDVVGRKTWIGGPEEKPSIQLQLYRDGSAYDKPVTLASGETEYIWKDLDLTNNAGKEYIYTVKEVGVPENYDKVEEELTVTNTNNEVIDIEVDKVWIGPKAEEVEITLYADGIDTKETLILNEENDWEASFEDLDKYNKTDGALIVYTVIETEIDNYDSQVTGSMEEGFTVTNTNNEVIDIEVDKVWIGPKAEEVEITLYADGIDRKETLILNEENDWEASFEDLDKYNKTDGELIVYTVVETAIDNYDSVVTGSVEKGFTVTNTNNELIDVEVEKTWIGPKADQVEITLYADGEATEETLVLNEDNEWEDNFRDLDKYNKEDGALIVYTVVETEIDNYDSQVTGKAEEGFTVTNTYVSPTKDITATKAWVGGPEVKPTIELQLYRHIGNEEKSKVGDSVKLEDGTTIYTWENLDVTDSAGVEYIYTVGEVETPVNYTKVEEGMKVTNTYVSPTKDITGRKVWVDGPEKKPTIELQLLRDGEAYLDPVELADGRETYTWRDLDLTDKNGVEYEYTIDEVKVPENYEKAISKDGLTITNKYIEPKIPTDPEDPESPTHPKTGEASNIALYLLGGLFILLGWILRKRIA